MLYLWSLFYVARPSNGHQTDVSRVTLGMLVFEVGLDMTYFRVARPSNVSDECEPRNIGNAVTEWTYPVRQIRRFTWYQMFCFTCIMQNALKVFISAR